ncbi:MAG: hypothetical protein WBX25_27265 [Rhodomicrobium sp.]
MTVETEPKPPRKRRPAKPKARRLKVKRIEGLELELPNLNWKTPDGDDIRQMFPSGLLHRTYGEGGCHHWTCRKPKGVRVNGEPEDDSGLWWLSFCLETEIKDCWVTLMPVHPLLVELEEGNPDVCVYANSRHVWSSFHRVIRG